MNLFMFFNVLYQPYLFSCGFCLPVVIYNRGGGKADALPPPVLAVVASRFRYCCFGFALWLARVNNAVRVVCYEWSKLKDYTVTLIFDFLGD